MTRAAAATLVLGWGNPSRGDDALGPTLCDRIEDAALVGVEVIQDFQLQIEHALDLAGRHRVLFIDAGIQASVPFSFARIGPEIDASHTTHALSPQAVLATALRLGQPLPEAWLLVVAGDAFELGEPLSKNAATNLDAAWSFVRSLLSLPAETDWPGGVV